MKKLPMLGSVLSRFVMLAISYVGLSLAASAADLSPEQQIVFGEASRAAALSASTALADGSNAHPYPFDGSVTASGGPAEDTKWWLLPTSKKHVYISYDLFSIPDTLDVYYEDRLVYSTNGLKSGAAFVPINCGNGTALKLKVIVNKGNNTDTGTAWTYSIFARAVELTDDNDGSVIRLDGTAWITGDSPPLMPKLVARVRNPDSATSVKWSFKCDYKRPRNASFADDTVKIPADGTTISLPADQPFVIWNYYGSLPFFGGDAVLNYTVGDDPPEKITFKILGQNPTPAVARDYFDNALGAPRVFLRDRQIGELFPGGGVYTTSFGRKKASAGGRAFVVGEPLWGADANGPGGFGMFQLTLKSPLAPREILWNWQANATAGRDLLLGKRADAEQWMSQQRQNSLRDASKTVSVPTESYHGENSVTVSFAEGSGRVIEDAVAIKRLQWPHRAPGINAYPSSGHYCYWDTSPVP